MDETGCDWELECTYCHKTSDIWLNLPSNNTHLVDCIYHNMEIDDSEILNTNILITNAEKVHKIICLSANFKNVEINMTNINSELECARANNNKIIDYNIKIIKSTNSTKNNLITLNYTSHKNLSLNNVKLNVTLDCNFNFNTELSFNNQLSSTEHSTIYFNNCAINNVKNFKNSSKYYMINPYFNNSKIEDILPAITSINFLRSSITFGKCPNLGENIASTLKKASLFASASSISCVNGTNFCDIGKLSRTFNCKSYDIMGKLSFWFFYFYFLLNLAK